MSDPIGRLEWRWRNQGPHRGLLKSEYDQNEGVECVGMRRERRSDRDPRDQHPVERDRNRDERRQRGGQSLTEIHIGSRMSLLDESKT
jgi:hypothetical protein